MKQIVLQYFSIFDKSDYEKKLHVPKLIERLVWAEDLGNSYVQGCINWLKRNAEIMSKIDSKYLCCKIYYEMTVENNFISSTENDVQEFKKYHWPIESENLTFHLQKTIVGFMNKGGGIIYMGLFEEKTKCVKVSGIELKKNEK